MYEQKAREILSDTIQDDNDLNSGGSHEGVGRHGHTHDLLHCGYTFYISLSVVHRILRTYIPQRRNINLGRVVHSDIYFYPLARHMVIKSVLAVLLLNTQAHDVHAELSRREG